MEPGTSGQKLWPLDQRDGLNEQYYRQYFLAEQDTEKKYCFHFHGRKASRENEALKHNESATLRPRCAQKLKTKLHFFALKSNNSSKCTLRQVQLELQFRKYSKTRLVGHAARMGEVRSA
jgi:hypothetical protein